MVCNCPAHVLRRRTTKKRVQCKRSSRRLGEVYKFCQKEIAKVRTDAANLKQEQCEHNWKAWKDCRDMLYKYASLLELRTKYLALIPWRIADADSQDGAAACLEQLNATADDRLDPLSRRVKDTLRPDLQVVAEGGAPSEALMREITILRDTPLDEGSGEGYHRGTNLVQQRAPASTTQTIVQEVRLDMGLERIERVQKRFG